MVKRARPSASSVIYTVSQTVVFWPTSDICNCTVSRPKKPVKSNCTVVPAGAMLGVTRIVGPFGDGAVGLIGAGDATLGFVNSLVEDGGGVRAPAASVAAHARGRARCV